ncbi:hypothetical protein WCT79_20305 [Pectobacterium carotovorum]|uniref:hypothetical protein n=1 Tax=Pectobacterium carotovorum TaxID=554 RepID=UPI003018C8DE
MIENKGWFPASVGSKTIITNDGSVVANVSCYCDNSAVLMIAAAPDLLEALDGIIADEGRGWAAINPPRTEAAKAAIAKAKGES